MSDNWNYCKNTLRPVELEISVWNHLYCKCSGISVWSPVLTVCLWLIARSKLKNERVEFNVKHWTVTCSTFFLNYSVECPVLLKFNLLSCKALVVLILKLVKVTLSVLWGWSHKSFHKVLAFPSLLRVSLWILYLWSGHKVELCSSDSMFAWRTELEFCFERSWYFAFRQHFLLRPLWWKGSVKNQE